MRRRDFLKAAGSTGLFLFFSGAGLAIPQEPERIPDRPTGYPTDFNAYLHIRPDGRVGCFVGKVEMGQGSMTALAALAAEELDVPLDAVDMLMGDTDLCPWDMGTWGSLSVWQFGPVLRAAAAEARAVLLELAAARLVAPVGALRVEGGVVSVASDASRKVSYGELVQGRRIQKHLTNVTPKPVAAYRVVGRDQRRKDARDKITGRAKYAEDLSLPGMLHACVVRPPAIGAVRERVDTSLAEKLRGVRVVRDGNLLAVLHPSPDGAREALAKVKAVYRPSPATPDDRTIFDHLIETAPPTREVAAKGNPALAAAGAQVTEATYLNSYVAHAPIETHSALAHWEQGRVTLWVSTQAPFLVKGMVARALNLAERQVRVITPYVGGGFGGKSAGMQAIEVARLARAAGYPVLVAWDRREEFLLDTFRPAAVVKIRSGVDGAGRIAFYEHHVYCAGDRGAELPYDVPHQKILASGTWSGEQPAGLHPVGVGPWRAPAANTNVFARESHLDTMARQAGKDPVAFRLAHLTDARMIRVLETAANHFGWTPKALPSGRGFGVAFAEYRDTMVAACAEVDVNRATGQVRVKRVTLAQDMGLVVNPDGARQQIEGCIIMGLGYALSEEVRFRGGEVLDRNFDTYQLPRFSWVPAIETILVPNPGHPAQGGGEPPITVMGAVLANAIHDATGARFLQLPMTPERIRTALA